MKRNYYWCLTFNHAWIVKCYTDEEVKRYKGNCYYDMKLIG